MAGLTVDHQMSLLKEYLLEGQKAVNRKHKSLISGRQQMDEWKEGRTD